MPNPVLVALVLSEAERVQLVLQRQFESRWSVTASAVVAGAGLVLASSAPGRAPERGGDADGGCEDECGEQVADLVARQRD